ncbi:MAG: cell division protein ZapA [Alphaproteobacteria bacterium]|jgi:cell division protein ZapA (FtsZ GTPase activity inhibitor)|nr:cell division protein ZapA [Alphaproteobacteria bacterium]
MKNIELKILGKSFIISANESEEEHLQMLSEFINEKSFTGSEDFSTKALMTLINLADELYKTYNNIGMQKEIISKQKELNLGDKKEIENLKEDREKTARFLSIVLSKLKTANNLLEKK